MKQALVNLSLFLLALAAAFYFLGDAQKPLGGVGSDPSYGVSGATHYVTACPAGTSTQIVAAQSGRTSFTASWLPTSTLPVHLCKGSSCSPSAGFAFVLATNTPRYEQGDSYVGPWSCIAITTTTAIGGSYSQ